MRVNKEVLASDRKILMLEIELERLLMEFFAKEEVSYHESIEALLKVTARLNRSARRIELGLSENNDTL